MGRKVSAYALCILFLVQILAGCAEMTEQQRGAAVGSGVGAAAGAGLGAIFGGGKGAAIGAATGAVVGGLVGWQIGEYRAKQIKNGPEAEAAHHYSPQQGVRTTIDKTAAAPHQVKPGDQIAFKTTYTVLAPPERGTVKVKEVRTVLFNHQELTRVEKTAEWAPGTYTTEHSMTLPKEAAAGSYTVKTIVQPLDVEKAAAAKATTTFVVGGQGGYR